MEHNRQLCNFFWMLAWTFSYRVICVKGTRPRRRSEMVSWYERW